MGLSVGANVLMARAYGADDKQKSEKIVYTAMSFSIITGITVLSLFISRKRIGLSIICTVILLTDLVLLLIFKETAIIELFPIFSGYIMLGILNFKKEKALIEAKR